MRFFSWSNRFLLGLLLLAISACQNTRSRNQEENNQTLDDPSIQFTEELTFLEPPSQRSLTNQRFRNSQQISATNAIALPTIQPLAITGDIELSGSLAIAPLNDLIYKRFIREGYSGIINSSGIYSDTAIQLFCESGKFDVITVTRPMSDQELATCQANNRQPLDFAIAKDALVVVVHRQDNFIKNLTLPRLTQLFQAEKWSDVNSTWPDESIERFLITPETLLFDLFPEKFSREEPIINPLNSNFYKFYQPLTQELSATRYGFGYINYPSYQFNAKSFRAVPVEGQIASAETVQTGVYPFSRSLFLYTDLNQLQQKPQVSAFINFYLTNVDQEIEKAGYLPLGEQELNQSKNNWLKAMDVDK
ncbi:MAG: substrate-binding domain-containing protein [Cyanobacteria bacterium P01_F01_bin.143]